MTAWLVTGTDTEVGKTFTTCALIHAARAAGHITLGMKPIAAGATLINDQLINEDAARLLAAGSHEVPMRLLNPYCFERPVSPHIAALDGIELKLDVVEAAFNALQETCEHLFVEGAGGLLVPLSTSLDAVDLAKKLALPVILVVGMRLGCINHALLTAEVIATRGLQFAGWIANCINPDMPNLVENIDTLRARLKAPLLGILPYSPDTAAEDLAHLLTLPA